MRYFLYHIKGMIKPDLLANNRYFLICVQFQAFPNNNLISLQKVGKQHEQKRFSKETFGFDTDTKIGPGFGPKSQFFKPNFFILC